MLRRKTYRGIGRAVALIPAGALRDLEEHATDRLDDGTVRLPRAPLKRAGKLALMLTVTGYS